MNMAQCPYTDKPCPKVTELEERVSKMERNQVVMMRLLYFIAGIVSVTLGVDVII